MKHKILIKSNYFIEKNLIHLLLCVQLIPVYGQSFTAIFIILQALKIKVISKDLLLVIFCLLISAIITIFSPWILQNTYQYSGWSTGAYYSGNSYQERLVYILYFFATAVFYVSIKTQKVNLSIPSPKFLCVYLIVLVYISQNFVKVNTGEAGRVGLPSSLNPNQFGYVIIFCVAALMLRKEIEARFYSVIAVVSLALYAVVLSASRTAIFTVVIICVYVVFEELNFKKSSSLEKLIKISFTIGVLSATCIWWILVGNPSTFVNELYFFERLSTVGGIDSRISNLWPSIISRIENPLVGNGVGSLSAADSLYVRVFHDFGLFGLIIGTYCIVKYLSNSTRAGWVLIFVFLIIGITNESLIFGISVAPLFLAYAAYISKLRKY
jgi:hypothetical protein